MPRDGSGVASKPAGTTATPNTTIESSKFNSVIDDIYSDMNLARPITAGGTGSNSAGTARTSLGTAGLDDKNAFTKAQTLAEGAAIASASTLTLGDDGNFFHVTGTTTITAISGAPSPVTLVFDGALTLTHNATSLILLGGANIVTAAGDTAIFIAEGSGNWRCTSYHRAAVSPSALGWETIAGSGAFTAQSNIDFTGLSAYTRLKISLWLTPATDATTIGFRTRTGGSVDAGASDYNYFYIFAQEAGVPTRFGLTVATIVPLNINNVGSAANESMHVKIEIEQFNKATYMSAFYELRELSATPVAAYASGGFSRLNASARDGFRIAVSSGTTVSGTILVEGMRG